MSNFTERELILELYKRKVRDSFWEFCLYMDDEFFIPRQEVLKDIADSLSEAWHSDKPYYRLAISTPPRTGKSYMLSLFIGWSLGNDFKREILRGTYGESLSITLHQSVRALISTKKYTELFTLPKYLEETKTKLHFENHGRPSLYATNVRGATTGYGGSIAISDDLYKDMGEAMSEAVNNSTNSWYNTAFQSRLDGDKMLEIVVGTRWRNDEVVDRLEKAEHFDKVIKLPALVNDKSFCEKIHSTETLLSKRKTMTTMEFQAIYQQEPALSADSLITPEMLEFVDYNDYDVYLRFAFMDGKTSGKDYFSIPMFALTNIGIVVEDFYFRNEVLTDKMENDIATYINMYEPLKVAIETNKDASFLRYFKKKTSSKCYGVYTTIPKKVKILNNVKFIRKLKFIRSNDKEYMRAMTNMYSYDINKENQHDDAIDAIVMGIIEMMKSKKLGGKKWLT